MLYQNNYHSYPPAALLSVIKPKAILLSIRETEVMILMCKEQTTKQIAAVLNISPHTVESYKKSLRVKTDSVSELGVVVFAVKNNIFMFAFVISLL